MASTNRIAWLYTDDDGNQWRVAAQKFLTDQAVLGGSAASGSDPQRPFSGRMRRCSVSDGAGHSRVVPVYEKTAPITTAGTSINVNVLGSSTAMTSNGGFLPEGVRRNVTKQTS